MGDSDLIITTQGLIVKHSRNELVKRIL